ncbi:hypothetical protein T4B_10307 [Trichinella pseudospiralis]|uniref:Uncharacterized protein n=2 Tax=Trichinella pseudospiralis TaxID=6337 RepID=A0A0V1E726_TRIPS|nr:hypothetical protein T4A_734 [Trichinella pseudospiralis]KRY88713.1 hypothetical protein T4D_3057 [Trichinella pseudospiralis]KRZ24163.1 hypothetical protein T4B_10307 [Trichinella pseudospiralis]KRZ36212.1 hypothetical protein T4C_413 [Trichinella pseudospiralis]
MFMNENVEKVKMKWMMSLFLLCIFTFKNAKCQANNRDFLYVIPTPTDLQALAGNPCALLRAFIDFQYMHTYKAEIYPLSLKKNYLKALKRLKQKTRRLKCVGDQIAQCRRLLYLLWSMNPALSPPVIVPSTTVPFNVLLSEMYLSRVVIDFGRSNGKPNPRDQIICAIKPIARDTPNNTV